ncbi:hypothetical protein [Ornithinimicrobium sufpigmenti]|uniref:hypothetical protein n=1 Tax=Ornithinimicrobium sufpigmenti TaxID=2508882 RepID=UPI001035DE25|nr:MULTISPECIES: hypothetical protein [unclassified Ornithinimicrobium]
MSRESQGGTEVERPVTGDPAVDRVLADLQQAIGDDPEQVVTALTEAHRRLQARLSDPGPTPPR